MPRSVVARRPNASLERLLRSLHPAAVAMPAIMQPVRRSAPMPQVQPPPELPRRRGTAAAWEARVTGDARISRKWREVPTCEEKVALHSARTSGYLGARCGTQRAPLPFCSACIGWQQRPGCPSAACRLGGLQQPRSGKPALERFSGGAFLAPCTIRPPRSHMLYFFSRFPFGFCAAPAFV